MPTSDLQRMHQDEFLADLRSGQFHQVFGRIRDAHDNRCVLGVAYEQVCDRPSRWATRTAKVAIVQALGVSLRMANELMKLNDGNFMPFERIADWFKAERDALDGDLSEWPQRGVSEG